MVIKRTQLKHDCTIRVQLMVQLDGKIAFKLYASLLEKLHYKIGGIGLTMYGTGFLYDDET